MGQIHQWAMALFIIITANPLLAATLSENEKAAIRVQVRLYCDRYDYRGAATYLMEHPAFPSRQTAAAEYDDAQAWLANTRSMLAGMHQIHGHLADSGKRLVDSRLAGPLRDGTVIAGANLAAIADGRVQLEFDGRTRVVDLTDLSAADYYGLGNALLVSLGDRQGVATQIALWQMLVGDADAIGDINDALKPGDHPLVPFLQGEVLGYAAAMRQIASGVTAAPPVGPSAGPPVGDPVVSADQEPDAADADRKGPKPADHAGLRSIRGPRDRKSALSRHGASSQIEGAIENALKWFGDQQHADGYWNGGNTVGATSLVLLVYLAEGQVPGVGDHGDRVKKGLDYLAEQMEAASERGIACGGRAYSHAMATQALAEGYVLTRSGRYYDAMEAGLARIIDGQQVGGGFDYRYRKGNRWDLSLAGWQVQAMVACKSAGSKHRDLDAALEKVAKHIIQDAYKDKKFGYNSPGTGGNMTGVGTYCLQLLGEGSSREVSGGLDTISGERSDYFERLVDEDNFYKDGGRGLYGWYYDTGAMFNEGGSKWRSWRRNVERTYLKTQHDRGYWAFQEGHNHGDSNDTDRILSTCYVALQLQAPYRYPPDYGARVKRAR